MMLARTNRAVLTFLISTGLFVGCSQTQPAPTAVSTPADPVAVVGSISVGVKTAGASIVPAADKKGTDSHCDVHGYPNGLNQSDPNYPGYLTHCFMTIDSGDTVLGGFETPNMVSCIVKAAGIVYDGVAHQIAVTDAMITACAPPDGGMPSGTMLTITGSAPASFNANYANGVVVDLSSSIGLTFKMAANAVGTTNSFITSEAWSDGSIGTTSGTLDTSTGDLWYESRVERNDCTTASRCGWNRHTRIHASLTMSGTTPTNLNSLTFGYSNIQFTPGQNGFGGTVITASGDLTTGIKSRLWSVGHGGDLNAAPTDATDYDVLANWVEVPNTACYTATSESATTCDTGLALFSTNTKFLLNATDSHMPVATWFTSITGQTFTAVNMDADTQF